MDFEYSEDQQAFNKEVIAFCDDHDTIEIFDVTRENMAQIVDTPERRAFMKEVGHQGWLGITWPTEYGGQEGEGGEHDLSQLPAHPRHRTGQAHDRTR